MISSHALSFGIYRCILMFSSFAVIAVLIRLRTQIILGQMDVCCICLTKRTTDVFSWLVVVVRYFECHHDFRVVVLIHLKVEFILI